jgi:transketolase
VGVAEANMAGVATGLAQLGYRPFLYSIATFASMRAYEQVRNGPALHGLPVTVVGIGGGFAYGHAGPTHFGLEDLCLARVQPGMAAVAPSDPAQARAVVHAVLAGEGPAYLRIGKGSNPEIPGLDGRFAWGRPELVRTGRDVLFVATGGIATEALAAAALLEDQGGVSTAVAVLAHVAQDASPDLERLLEGFTAIVSVEEGYAYGGLGSLLAETLARTGHPARLRICAVRDQPAGAGGSERYLRTRFGLDASALARAARELRAAPRRAAPSS